MHRHISIERAVTPAKAIASYIRLRGLWLREHGFEPGQKVAVRILSKGVLELRASEDEADDAGTVEEVPNSPSLAANIHALIKNGMLK